MASRSLKQTVAAWSLAGAMALLALGAIHMIAIAGPVAALALFFGAYVAAGQRSIAAAVGFPLGLLLALACQNLLPVTEFTGKTMELGAYVGLVGFFGSVVANIVNRRSPLLAAFEAVAYYVVFAVVYVSMLYFGYFFAVGCQLFLPRTSFLVAGVLVVCLSGGLAGAVIGICLWVTGRPQQPFPRLQLH
jgi:hypothetical protein